ncbi:MAG: hypothetical protein O7E55_05545 [Chloroflexi bacterium]|nr:hypothetical protein [Chloroflexota bacterium]
MSDKADHPAKSDGLSEEQRWQAVLTRDGRYDGEFVYGDILESLNCGDISRRQAAKELGTEYATLKRLLDAHSPPSEWVGDFHLQTALHARHT